MLELLARDRDRYLQVTPIAFGAEAVVFSAHYAPVDRKVGIKVLRTPGATTAARKRREERFLREAQALWDIKHANVVRIYEVIDVVLDGIPTKAFTMEWLPGNMARRMSECPKGIPANEFERYLSNALRGLAALQSHRIAVRDIRPENLLLDSDQTLKVSDLGMARTGEGGGSMADSSRYLAPEVLSGTIRTPAGGDPEPEAYFAADIYSLGLIFYEAAVGGDRWESLPQLASVYGGSGPGSGLEVNRRWDSWHCDASLHLQKLASMRGDLEPRLSVLIDSMVAKSLAVRTPSAAGALQKFASANSDSSPPRAEAPPTPANRAPMARPQATVSGKVNFLKERGERAALRGVGALSSLGNTAARSVAALWLVPRRAVMSKNARRAVWTGSLVLLVVAVVIGARLVRRHHGSSSATKEDLSSSNRNSSLNSSEATHFAALHVESVPTGAGIYLNGRGPFGETPRTVKELSVSDVELTLKMSGYEDYTVTVSLAADRTTDVGTIALHPANGDESKTHLAALHVASVPAGAEIYLDGKSFGRTPQTVTGLHAAGVELTLKKSGYESYTTMVFLFSNQTIDVGQIELRAVPDAAQSKPTPVVEAPDGMVLVPSSYFKMGSSDGGSDERPVHKVNIGAFYIDKTEVTNRQFAAFVKASAYVTSDERAGRPPLWRDGIETVMDDPVVNVTWDDAVAYSQWANKRLPTEAEWECAARGGISEAKFPWGNDDAQNRANMNGAGGKDHWEHTSPVASFAANSYGLFDMAGNVWEWCSDWYEPSQYSSSQEQNPHGPNSGIQRVVRGGSWNSSASGVRCAERGSVDPSSRSADLGFRCVKGAPQM